MTAPYINPAPATLDACFAELTRLGTLRELDRIPDADYYAADAALTARIAELKADAAAAEYYERLLDRVEMGLVYEAEADAELVAGLVIAAEVG